MRKLGFLERIDDNDEVIKVVAREDEKLKRKFNKTLNGRNLGSLKIKSETRTSLSSFKQENLH